MAARLSTDPSFYMLAYAIKIFKQFNNPKNLKAKTAIQVLDAATNDVLIETNNYGLFVKEVPREDICWLYSFDYTQNGCADHIRNMDEYKKRLEKLMELYLR